MKTPFVRPPKAVVVGLVLAVVLDTLIQITWKLAVAGVPETSTPATTLRVVLTSPYFVAAMLAFAAQLWNWMRVLARADLSYAQPFTALSYLTVLGFSAHSLHEQISLARCSGVALILLGVYFISRTPFRTLGGAAPMGTGVPSPHP